VTWSERFTFREAVHRRYGRIHDIPLARKRLRLILRYLRDGESTLEVGAFDRGLGGRIRDRLPGVRYKSLDIDPAYPHDYASFDEIDEHFDLVLLFEVIEHLGIEEGETLVSQIHRVLRPGGRVILTTPNLYMPGQYWKDISHRTPYHYEELGALFLSRGFEIEEIRRMAGESPVGLLLKAGLFGWVFRFLGIDFTKSILLVARKRIG
jgi:SAM-dependent methyltransferase